jgi:cytidylate kinase
MSRALVIAIDGPAAAGKTTLALELARRLGYLYFDTGVMYRAVALAALRHGINVRDEVQVIAAAERIQIDVLPPTVNDGRPSTVLLDGEDVTWQLRDGQIDANVSVPSAYAGVREAMTRQQRRIAEGGGVVMVGRDIGTVVLPDADLKLFLTATVEARAHRRWQEYAANGQDSGYGQILEAMHRRDEIDSRRSIAPLRAADDALIIDTTALDAEQVLALVLDHVARIQAGDRA